MLSEAFIYPLSRSTLLLHVCSKPSLFFSLRRLPAWSLQPARHLTCSLLQNPHWKGSISVLQVRNLRLGATKWQLSGCEWQIKVQVHDCCLQSPCYVNRHLLTLVKKIETTLIPLHPPLKASVSTFILTCLPGSEDDAHSSSKSPTSSPALLLNPTCSKVLLHG